MENERNYNSSAQDVFSEEDLQRLRQLFEVLFEIKKCVNREKRAQVRNGGGQ